MAVFATARSVLTLGLLASVLVGCGEKQSDSPGVRLIENSRQSGLPTVV